MKEYKEEIFISIWLFMILCACVIITTQVVGCAEKEIDIQKARYENNR